MSRQPLSTRAKWLIAVVVVAALGAKVYWEFNKYRVAADTGHPAEAQEPLGVIAEAPLTLTPIARDFALPTDLQWVTGQDTWIVLEKSGDAWWLSADGSARGKLLHVEVATGGEEGLLGLALHPQFAQNGRFFLNYVARIDGHDFTRIAEWHLAGDVRHGQATPVNVALEIAQPPYENHKAGQLQFGPDGMLYIGVGDGGSGGDPHGNGQNPAVLLGKMLRIDVDHQDPGLHYAVPRDNPFVGKTGWRPEIWALGLRNPWRFSFDRQGRLIVADVGQNLWEELDIVEKGANLGWNTREGRHCFKPTTDCQADGFAEPIVEYSHKAGQSITGGYVAFSRRVPNLFGRYVMADFVNGKMWAVDLPQTASGTARVWSLGQFSQHLATFGRTEFGDVYAADVYSGAIVRLDP